MINRELNFEGTSPILYLVSTPIGNLQELSPRALAVIKDADFIAAEDTRNSGKLLSFFGIKKPFITCQEHNEKEASSKIISLLKEGKKVVYMSDAGYPAISDPGSKLVSLALNEGIKVSVTSGPCAAINALACSGIDSTHFYFEGFLPPKENERNERLTYLGSKEETLIFYESPHRISKTLNSLNNVLGNRKACIARELTKAHEEFIRGTLEELASLDEESLIGEMVIVVEGNKNQNKEFSKEEITAKLKQKLDKGVSSKDAIKEVSVETKTPKNDVYSIYLETLSRR